MPDLTYPRLLQPNEPAAYRIEREQGPADFIIICDHASNRIPQCLNSLGVSAMELQRHIAWDIGAASVASKLAVLLDAFVILQNYSRLVIDCNRPIGSPGSIVTVSEHTPIPGNCAITSADAVQRQQEIFWPYHNRIRAELDARVASGRHTILISMHSFTPTFKSQTRDMHAGVLYQRDTRLAHRVLNILRAEPNLVIGDNEPYSVSDLTDYAIPEYGEKRGLLHLEMEIRQDLIAVDDGQSQWAERMATVLRKAVDMLQLTLN
jgi:predicted N-formylglutamate amidohydrolase